ncbi:MAG: metal ABC transporter permease [Thermoguttaceae bacterium]|jgi:zinc transport system permease protein
MQPEFLRNAYLLTAIASVIFGAIGAFVVARRIGYLAGAIAHCAFGGVGLGLWLKQRVAAGALGTLALATLFSSHEGAAEVCRRWSEYIEPVPAAFIFSLLAALLVDYVRRRAQEREETIIGAIWAIGAAVGLLFLDRVHGYVTATTYLFGDVLLVSKKDVWISVVLGAIILASLLCNFKKLEAVCFDEEFARLRGINIQFQNRLLLVLTASTVVILMRVVGMALIVALLTLPAATASRFTKRLGTTIIGSIVVCFAGSWLGIWLSYLYDFSTGPTIILVVALFYVAALALSRPVCLIKGQIKGE